MNTESQTTSVLDPSKGQGFLQEIIKKVKLLPRDVKKYPEVSNDDKVDAGSFIYALQTMGAGGDGNLTSLIWNLWANLADCVQTGALTEALQDNVKDLNEYLKDIGFFDESKEA